MDWEKVVADIGPRLMRYFVASYPHAQAADLVQEVLLRLVRLYQDGAFDPARGNIAMFAFGVAINIKREAHRTAKASLKIVNEKDALAIADDTHGPDMLAEAAQQRKQLRAAISQLNSIEKEVIMLYMDDELNLADMGVILGLPVGTVKSHIHRAKENLKQLLQQT